MFQAKPSEAAKKKMGKSKSKSVSGKKHMFMKHKGGGSHPDNKLAAIFGGKKKSVVDTDSDEM